MRFLTMCKDLTCLSEFLSAVYAKILADYGVTLPEYSYGDVWLSTLMGCYSDGTPLADTAFLVVNDYQRRA
jgi:hypothetical protein